MARSSSKKKSTSLKIDFTGVQSRQLLPEDDYLVSVEEVNKTTSSNDNEQLEFVFAVKEGKFEGQKLWFYCPLTDNSLWKLHGLLTALGIEVPDDELDLDLEELVGLDIMAVVQHETYDGVKRSKMMDFYAVEEGGAKDEGKKSSKKKAEKEDDDDDESPAAKRKARREARKAKASGKSKDDADEDDEKPSRGSKRRGAKDEDDDEDEKPSRRRGRGKDDDDEDEKPARGKKGGKKPTKVSADEVQGMDEDELESLIEKYDLEVELDDYKTLRKKAAAVIDALEDKDLIEDDE